MIRILKGILSVLLFICFFMPLSRCQTHDLKAPGIVEEQRRSILPDEPGERYLRSSEKPAYLYFIPSQKFDVTSWGSWLRLGMFTWPIPLLILSIVTRAFWARRVINAVELAAGGFSLYMLWLVVFLGETLFWGYITISVLIMYLFATSWELLVAIIEKFRHSKSDTPLKRDACVARAP